MKIYAPNSKPDGIGGGFTFYRNFRKGMSANVHFVDSWQECDIVFITSVTLIEKSDVFEAKQAGKKIVLRVDNVPRKSRNNRSSPHERLREFADLADVVVYQSEWAKGYCYPLCGDGTIIHNGVDTSVFRPDPALRDKNNYIFAYHGKNEQKNFWEAWLIFQYIARDNHDAVFYFTYNFGNDFAELEAARFDFWNGEKFVYLPPTESPEEMAERLQRCGGGLIYPAIADAAPNIVLEARACGCPILGAAPAGFSGTKEMIDLEDISLERMCEEYYGVFIVLLNEKTISI